jgi:Do/DeqQ family serine protease
MKLTTAIRFFIQAIIAGLALAFIVVFIWPRFGGQSTSSRPVEFLQSSSNGGPPTAGPVSYAYAVNRAAPAVVNINTAKVITVQPHPFFNDPIFRQFFGNGSDLIKPQKQVVTSLGSGVILSHDGYILTNNHVVRGADAIQVSLRDGRHATAKVIGTDPDTDLAILKISLKNLPVITLGNSDKIHIGDVVLAIGNPFGVGQTVTMGIISATGRNKLGINTFENFIQTDAAINPGNSGGALVDTNGNLIGINSAIFSKSGGYQGIGFSIPMSLAKNVMADIIEYGRPLRGWLGIEAHQITPSVAKSLELKSTNGVIVVGVTRNGPAHKAGVVPGDVILAIDGKTIESANDALNQISRHRPNDKIKLTVWRDGKTMDIVVTAIERPRASARGGE